MKKILVFDLDGTLIDTSKLSNYRKTRDGLEYVSKKAEKLTTKEYSPVLKEIAKKFSEKNQFAIITNASENYALALLRKHGFPEGPLFYNSKKPSPENLFAAMKYLNAEKALVIGDEAIDVLMAHEAEMPSAGVLWGSYTTKENMMLAEPSITIESPDNLEQAIIDFEKEKIKYEPRKLPSQYEFAPEDKASATGVQIASTNKLGTYYPVKLRYSDYFSRRILRFKRARDFLREEIEDFAMDSFFYGRRMYAGEPYLENIKFFAEHTIEKLDSMNLEGNTIIVPAPNSNPSFCYRTDINDYFAEIIEKYTNGKYKKPSKIVERVFPIKKASASIIRPGRAEHFRTIGFKRCEMQEKPDNIIIFDDIITTGAQTEAIAQILAYFGFTAKMHILALGETAEYYGYELL